MHSSDTVQRKGKNRFLLAAISLAVLLATFFGFLSHRQPSYQNRTVNSWLKQVYDTKRSQPEALDALNKMGADAVPPLIEALAKTDSSVDRLYRRIYIQMPAGIRRVLPMPVEADTLRCAAQGALLNNKHTREFMPELVRCLKEGNSKTRLYAAGVVADWIRAEDTFCIPTLIEVLNDRDAQVRDYAAHALSTFGPTAKAATPALEERLTDTSAQVRITAAMALSAIDAHTATRTIPVLKEAMTNGDSRIRHWAAVYLSNIDPVDRGTIPVFISSLTNQDRGIRISAAYSLLRYGPGPEAKDAAPGLVEALNDSDAEVRKAARMALERIAAHGQDH